MTVLFDFDRVIGVAGGFAIDGKHFDGRVGFAGPEIADGAGRGGNKFAHTEGAGYLSGRGLDRARKSSLEEELSYSASVI